MYEEEKTSGELGKVPAGQVETSDRQLAVANWDAVAAAVAGSSFMDGPGHGLHIYNFLDLSTTSQVTSVDTRFVLHPASWTLGQPWKTMDMFDSLSAPPLSDTTGM